MESEGAIVEESCMEGGGKKSTMVGWLGGCLLVERLLPGYGGEGKLRPPRPEARGFPRPVIVPRGLEFLVDIFKMTLSTRRNVTTFATLAETKFLQ